MIYYKKFIDFIKKHNLYDKESFIFISNHTKNIDYKNEEERDFIGSYYNTSEAGNIINFKIYVPEIIDEKTLLINIHEYIHALFLYKMLNKPCDIGLEKEILPLMYEKLYVLESDELSINQYQKDLMETINEINKPEYTIGNKLSDELLKYSDENLIDLNKKAKILARKYKK